MMNRLAGDAAAVRGRFAGADAAAVRGRYAAAISASSAARSIAGPPAADES